MDFPVDAVTDGGYQLYLVQKGEDPVDWKPMGTVGHGCYEIRIEEDSNAYRIIYVAKFEDAVFVLHCFQNTTPQTSQRDIDVAKDRYKALLQEMKK